MAYRLFQRIAKWSLPAALLVLPGTVLACDCVAPSIASALSNADAVFTGRVTKRIRLHSAQGTRPLYAVHFAVAETWKGPETADVTIYDAAPRGDCEGFGFKQGEEYLVFARQRVVRADLPVPAYSVVVPEIWKSAVANGQRILISELCTNTDELSAAAQRGALQQLGPGKKPR